MTRSLETTNQAKIPWLFICGIAAIVAGAFFAADHKFNFSTLNLLALDTDLDASPLRKFAFLGIAAMGGLLLLYPCHTAIRFNTVLGLVCLLYFTWLAGSIVWSVNPSISLKRVVTVAIVMVGVLGVARHLSMRDVVIMAFVASTALVLVGVLAEIRFSNFRPWTGDYRFTGTIHPNEQSGVCAVMCWSAWFSARHLKRVGFICYGLSILAFVLLVLTKSRTCFAAFVLACGALWMARATAQKKILVMMASAFALASVLMMVTVMELQTSEGLSSAAMFGRENEGDDADLGSLNGRLPLWMVTMRFAQERLLLGHGYGAFWSDEMAHKVAAEAGWLAPNSHSFWIDTVLSLGLFGLLLVLLGIAIFGRFLVRCVRHSDDPMVGFVFVVFVLAMITSISESDLHQPVSFLPFILAAGVSRLAFCRTSQKRKMTFVPSMPQPAFHPNGI